ncbi:MAG: energy transducer TonB [Deltaproteobacteria bacterium]|nr:energy transducer TonB [Deltaproteobacteria bacterium]
MTDRVRMQTAMASALLVNFVLFALLPATVGKPRNKMDLENLNVVNLVEIRREPPPPPEDEPPPEKEPPQEPPQELPPMSMPTNRPEIPKMELSLPSLSFEINAKLDSGMPVAAPPSAPPAPVDVFGRDYAMDEVDQVPVPLSQIKPVYPWQARRMRLDGSVDVRFLVDEDGMVDNIEIVSGRPEGIFDDSVRKALSGWRFTPGRKAGTAVRTWFVTTIEFKFEG